MPPGELLAGKLASGTDHAGWAGWQDLDPRLALAALTAFVTALCLGPPVIALLRRQQILDSSEKGDSERLDTIHAHKRTTPTLGGVILLAPTFLATLVWARWDSVPVLLLLGLLLAFGSLGFVDDVIKLRAGRKGLTARRKLLVQLLVSGAIGWILWARGGDAHVPGDPTTLSTALFFPFTGGFSVDLGFLYIPLVALVITGCSNAVNLTDGLDGLATGCSIFVSSAFVVVAVLAGSVASSAALSIPFVEGGAELAVFAAALTGAGLGFLWFNCHPARVFMGDTGALPLGGVLGLLAVLSKQELLLIPMAGVLVAEALSVMLQVFTYKMWRRRIFLIAPLHHHFQFKGWAETRVTVCFWIASAGLALGSLLILRVA